MFDATSKNILGLPAGSRPGKVERGLIFRVLNKKGDAFCLPWKRQKCDISISFLKLLAR